MGGSVRAQGGLEEMTWAVMGVSGGGGGWGGGTTGPPFLETTL